MTKKISYQLVEDLDEQIPWKDLAKRCDLHVAGIAYEICLSHAPAAELRAALEPRRKGGRIVRKSTPRGT